MEPFSSSSSTSADVQAQFEVLVNNIRPELHRYASRMTGSSIDGEDIVQDALIKAYASLESLAPDSNLRSWLFRITHNKAIDFLRGNRQPTMELLDEQDIGIDPDHPLEEQELTALALSMFLQLAPRQRSCLILKDVLDYSLAEISELLNATVPEIKAALHRGRVRLRELPAQANAAQPRLDAHEQTLLARYIDYFNARDFDSVRRMLTDEVELELVGRAKYRGQATVSGKYFYNYNRTDDWQFVLGMVEDRAAILVYNPHEKSSRPAYFILLNWEGDRVCGIRDYRHVPYIMQSTQSRF
jgi:RNA polymerase sigma-70 factor (ECF subfamily)